MPLIESLASRLARPASRVLDAPIRDIVHELLKEHGYASPAEVQGLRDEVVGLRARVESLDRAGAELSRLAEAARADADAARAAPPADPRVAELLARVAALDAALAESRAQVAAHAHALPAHEHAADPRVAALEARILELEARPAAAAVPILAAAASTASPDTTTATAPRAGCKVPGCSDPLRSKGFCSAHYQQWRRGTLKGFVNGDGTVLVDGRVHHLPSDTIGEQVVVRDGAIVVGGRPVKPLGK